MSYEVDKKISVVRMFIYAVFIVLILGFFKFAFGEEKVVTEKDYIYAVETVEMQQKQIEDLKNTLTTLNEANENLLEQIKLHEEDVKINEGTIIPNYKKIVAQQDDAIKFLDKLADRYREEIVQLESKGTKNKIAKVGTVAEHTGAGCLTGSLFAGVGVVPGCAIGFVTGLTKNFLSDMF